jgi:hypothetical protein
MASTMPVFGLAVKNERRLNYFKQMLQQWLFLISQKVKKAG